MRRDWARYQTCPICGHRDWCLVAKDGSAAICARTPSDRIVGNRGAGWLHKLGEGKRDLAALMGPPPKQRPIVRDWSAFHAACVEALPDQDDLARMLGVSDESLGLLGLGWSREHGCYTFPMRDGDNRIIGMRTRYRNGAKRSITGSRNGLFIPQCQIADLWICEGPTDAAALLTIGITAIGRPSNTGGMDLVIALVRARRGWRDIVIVADRDGYGTHADELTLYGAHGLADQLRTMRRYVRIVRPPQDKDVRDWVRSGATKRTLLNHAKEMRLLVPKELEYGSCRATCV